MRTGIANLPLHWGKAPQWLFSRMKRLAREMLIVIVEEYGPHEVLNRIADPYWFQAFGCVLGYDWHSSGLTTVTCGAIKEGLRGIEQELGLFVAGGKGRSSRKTPQEIIQWADKTHLRVDPETLVYASKMSAKIDSAAIQDGYQLYHHNFVFTQDGKWAVIQQGMPNFSKTTTKKTQYARRYHWHSDGVHSYVTTPHSGICDNYKYSSVLDLTARESKSTQEVIYSISKEKPQIIMKEYQRIRELSLPSREWIEYTDIRPENLEKVLISTYEHQPRSFEAMLGTKGLGAKSLRALTLIAEIAYGTKASWQDPVKYSFAHGGKDGYPYPVDKQNYDTSIALLKKAILKSKTDRFTKRNALQKLLL